MQNVGCFLRLMNSPGNLIPIRNGERFSMIEFLNDLQDTETNRRKNSNIFNQPYM